MVMVIVMVMVVVMVGLGWLGYVWKGGQKGPGVFSALSLRKTELES
jgi:hypothetical protein